MQKYRTFFANVGATTTDQELDTITVPQGRKYVFNIFGHDLSDDTEITVYLHDEEAIVFRKDGNASDDNLPLDWEAEGGTEIRVYATNYSGGALDCGAMLGYMDLPA